MVVRWSAPHASRLLPPRKIPGTHFRQRLSRPQGYSAAGRIRSIEKSHDLIGIRTRDLPACSVVPQPTTLPHAPQIKGLTRKSVCQKILSKLHICITDNLINVRWWELSSSYFVVSYTYLNIPRVVHSNNKFHQTNPTRQINYKALTGSHKAISDWEKLIIPLGNK
jgi:hypothetical protein